MYGRGALDMKDLVVMELQAFLQLKRDHVKLARDVIFCAVPDEEAGGAQGARYLIAQHRDEVQCEELLNEGGSGLASADARAAHGDPGGGARHLLGARDGQRQARPRLPGPPRQRPAPAAARAGPRGGRAAALRAGPGDRPDAWAMADTQHGLKGVLMHALANPVLMPLLAPTAVSKEPMLGSMLSNTVNPNVIVAGQKVNVVPAEASVELDIRVLPGHTTTETMAWLRQTLADPELHIDVLQAQEPSRSPRTGGSTRPWPTATRAAYPGIASRRS